MSFENINEIQDIIEKLQTDIGSLTPEKWRNISETLIEKGLEGLDDENKKEELLAFKGNLILTQIQGVYHNDDGDDSLACKSAEEDAKAAKVAQAWELEKEVYKKLCIYCLILGVSGTMAYKFNGTSIAEICKPFVTMSLQKALEELPKAVDALCKAVK